MSDRGEAIFCGKVLNFSAAIPVLCKSLSVASLKQLVLEGNQSIFDNMVCLETIWFCCNDENMTKRDNSASVSRPVARCIGIAE